MLNILEEMKKQKSKLKIIIKWILRYQNIAGNEKINAETKWVVKEKGKLESNPKYIIMKSTWNMKIKNAIKQQ